MFSLTLKSLGAARVFYIYLILVAFASPSLGANVIDIGKNAFEEGNYSNALKILMPLANSGNSDAQNLVGEIYYSTNKVHNAVEWFQRSANRENPIALNNLAYLYENGEGVSRDYAMAASYYRQAAMKGIVEAQLGLGKLLMNGRGVPKDENQARYWLDKAEHQGSNSARQYISEIENRASHRSASKNIERQVIAAQTRENEIEKAQEREYKEAQQGYWDDFNKQQEQIMAEIRNQVNVVSVAATGRSVSLSTPSIQSYQSDNNILQQLDSLCRSQCSSEEKGCKNGSQFDCYQAAACACECFLENVPDNPNRGAWNECVRNNNANAEKVRNTTGIKWDFNKQTPSQVQEPTRGSSIDNDDWCRGVPAGETCAHSAK